jgi:hypothetical protein
MLSFAGALNSQYFVHISRKNADGKTPVKVRRNGQTKTWKTRPGEFKIPVKYGLRQCFYITNANAHEWLEG